MKHLIVLILCLTTLSAVAQPPARRKAEAQKKEQNNTPKGAAHRDFPTAPAMPQDATWRRDIYLSLDLTKEANAVLYYPTVPTDGRTNLYTYLFKLLLSGKIKAYDYKLDGNEDFSEKNLVKIRDIMDRYKIYYESKGNAVRVNDADILAEEVKLYYIKVSRYFDQHTASFRSSVTAICPVLKRGDSEFGGSDTQYPMFWVKYSDVAPHLSKLSLMSSSLNNAATMSAEDFFSTAAYEGDIYKTTNLQDRILANYCKSDSALAKEQKRINREMTDFQDRMFGRDSVAMAKAAAEKALADSIAETQKATKRPTARRSTGRRSSSASAAATTTKAKKQQTNTPKASRSSGKPSRSGGGFSVRRQRH